jgi:hypothetical protein
VRIFFTRVFPWPFVLAGAVALSVGVHRLFLAAESERWPSVPGLVKTSEVATSRDSEGTTYHAHLVYTYEVAGKSREGTRVHFGDYGTSHPDHAQSVVDTYPAGKAVTVRYRPQDPSYAVLEPGLMLSAWMVPGLGLVFLIVGGAMVVWLPRRNSIVSRMVNGG